MTGSFKTYMLLHGAWHASWCWQRVVPMLAEKGHTVLAPDLPGHGQNKMAFSNITLKTYVDDITLLIKSTNKPVTLIGHSMSGIVISQIAENIPECIDKLVYCSAFILDDNSSLVQESSKHKSSEITEETVVNEIDHEVSLKLPGRVKEVFYNTCSEETADWAVLLLQKQPLQPLLDPIKISDIRFGKVPKVYIECLRDKAIKLEDQRKMSKKLGCEIICLDTDHSPFLCEPLKFVNAVLAGN
jgi:pimeloyl-ACP methyl ester carboxylesterase